MTSRPRGNEVKSWDLAGSGRWRLNVSGAEFKATTLAHNLMKLGVKRID
jgi:hypothetical protein